MLVLLHANERSVDEERKAAIGEYFTFRRKKKSQSAEIVFKYLQSASQSKIQEKRILFPEGKRVIELAINGEEYAFKGKILAWRAELHQDGEVIGHEQSYLW